MRHDVVEGIALARVGAQLVGVEMERVLAVLERPELTPLPCVPASCKGITLWQGQAVPVYDLKKALYLPAPGDDKGKEEEVVLVARWRHALVGLCADEVLRVIDAPPLDPPTFDSPHVRGEGTIDGKVLYVLDLDSEYPGLA